MSYTDPSAHRTHSIKTHDEGGKTKREPTGEKWRRLHMRSLAQRVADGLENVGSGGTWLIGVEVGHD
jgi:hypothetical protein